MDKTRMALLLYCHITEANFIYHCIYNMLLTIEGQSPKVFGFLDKYRIGVPPSVGAKLKEICARANAAGRGGITLPGRRFSFFEVRNDHGCRASQRR